MSVPFADMLERAAVPAALPADAEPSSVAEIAALSSAISLRRIADALDGTNGVSIADAIDRAIAQGMFSGFQNLSGRSR